MKYACLLMLTFIINSAVAKNLILYKGQGGDASGAKLISSKLSNTKSVIIKNSLSDINLDGYNNIFLCGQAAVNDFIKLDEKFYQGLNIQFYSHIYDDNIINFLLKHRIDNLTLFVIDSQKNKLKNVDAKIISAMRPLRTINKNYKYNLITNILHNDLIIFLGGKYINSHNELIEVRDQDIKKLLIKIKNQNQKSKSIAFVIHPRFTNDIKRIDILLDIFKGKKLQLYLPKTNFKNIIKNYPKISSVDNYDDIIETLAHNKLHKNKIYGTTDQYNLFTDLCRTIPVSFHDEDIDQNEYIKSLPNCSNLSSVTESVILFFSSRK